MEKKQIPEINRIDFAADINNGMTKSQLVEKYKVSPNSIKEIAKKLNLGIKREVKPKYILIDEPAMELPIHQEGAASLTN